MKIRKTQPPRNKELGIFKFSKQGIILTINRRSINISENILINKDETLDFLYSLLDEELVKQQKADIIEVINEFI